MSFVCAQDEVLPEGTTITQILLTLHLEHGWVCVDAKNALKQNRLTNMTWLSFKEFERADRAVVKCVPV